MPAKSLSVGGSSFSVQVLVTCSDFLAWNHDIEFIAAQQRTWKIITGVDAILEKPLRPVAGSTVPEREAYKRDREDFEKQQDQIKDLTHLLTESVDPSIRTLILDEKLDDPAKIYDHLKKTFQPNKSRSLVTAYNQMENIRWKKGMTITELASLFRRAKAAIESAEGKYDNAELVAKLSRTLPKEYDEFISRDIDRVTTLPTFDQLVTDLQSYETRIISRQKTKDDKGQGKKSDRE